MIRAYTDDVVKFGGSEDVGDIVSGGVDVWLDSVAVIGLSSGDEARTGNCCVDYGY